MAVSFVNVGAFTSATNSPTAAVPSSVQAGDLLIVLIESANESIATPTSTTGGTWTEVGTQASQALGTGAAIGAVRLAVYWKWWATGQTGAICADSGNHTAAQMIAFRGCDPVSPFSTTASGTGALNTSNHTFPSVTTVTPNAYIVLCAGVDRDSASTANYTSITNANLTGATERMDETVASGVGGGVCLYTATAAAAGAIGTTTLTKSSAFSGSEGFLTIALRAKRRTGRFS